MFLRINNVKRVLIYFVVALMVLPLSMQNTTGASDGGYPYAQVGGTGPSTGLWYKDGDAYSERRYAYRNCTDYVAWKLETLGVQASFVRGLGNANEWVSNATAKKIDVSTVPTYGSVAVSYGGTHGHVAFVEKVVKSGTKRTITTSEYNWPTTDGLLDGAYHERTTIAGEKFTQFINFGVQEDWRADGTFINIKGKGVVYRMLGGAPIRLTNWGVIPGCCSNVKAVSQKDFNTLRGYPTDGSFMNIHEAGGEGVYRFVGGAPIRLYNWGAVLGFDGKAVTVNFGSLQALDHMRAYPEDGVMMSIAEAGGSGIYTFAGGAPLRLYNWGIIPDFAGATDVNFKSLERLDHMVPMPKNGTFIAAKETGYVYRLAGGAPLRLYDQGSVPGFTGRVTWVNQKTVDRLDHMRATPSNGTVLRGMPSGRYWRIDENKRTEVTARTGAIEVNDRTVLDFSLE